MTCERCTVTMLAATILTNTLVAGWAAHQGNLEKPRPVWGSSHNVIYLAHASHLSIVDMRLKAPSDVNGITP